MSIDQLKAEIARLKAATANKKSIPKWCLSCDDPSLNGKHLCNACLAAIGEHDDIKISG